MTFVAQQKIKAMYMRGGTSKGTFFALDDLPKAAQVAGSFRDELLLRVVGSPDPYAKHTDGMGGATSSTSKVVIVSASKQQGHHIDYLFGQVAIDKAFIDWSGNCGNLTAAVGAFAIENGLINKSEIPKNGTFAVKIWQKNISKTIVAHIPIKDYRVQETGDFELDGVTFPAAEVKIEFIDPAASADDDAKTEDSKQNGVFPTGNLVDTLRVPGIGDFEATFIDAGIPSIFLNADELGYSGCELQGDINEDTEALKKFEIIRAYGALQMGLIKDLDEAQTRQHTPKIAFVSPARDYVSSSGKPIEAEAMDLHVRALSMGKLHHAMMGTAAVAIGTAAAIEGTLVNRAAGGGSRDEVTFAHPSGILTVGAEAQPAADNWKVSKVIMSRSARVLMEGYVRVPMPQ
jgi:probable AcnD-accessory protein PrpF